MHDLMATVKDRLSSPAWMADAMLFGAGLAVGAFVVLVAFSFLG